MKNNRRNVKSTRGITLIALVITIIILLILAGISIASLTGDNGILTKADTAKEENRAATIEEEKNLWKSNQVADQIIGETKVQKLGELLEQLQKEELITEEEKDTIIVEGEITIGKKTIVFGTIDTSDRIESIVQKNKDNEGNIDYEKLKEDLNKIKDIQGVPSDLTQEKFPLVVKIGNEFMEIKEEGTVRTS